MSVSNLGYQFLSEEPTDNTCEVQKILNWPFSFDVVVIAEHVLGPADKVPGVEEGWLRVGRCFPLRMGGDGTV